MWTSEDAGNTTNNNITFPRRTDLEKDQPTPVVMTRYRGGNANYRPADPWHYDQEDVPMAEDMPATTDPYYTVDPGATDHTIPRDYYEQWDAQMDYDDHDNDNDCTSGYSNNRGWNWNQRHDDRYHGRGQQWTYHNNHADWSTSSPCPSGDAWENWRGTASASSSSSRQDSWQRWRYES